MSAFTLSPLDPGLWTPDCLFFLAVMVDKRERLVPAQQSVEHLAERQHLVPASLGSTSRAQRFKGLFDQIGGGQYGGDWINRQAEPQLFEITGREKGRFASLDHV